MATDPKNKKKPLSKTKNTRKSIIKELDRTRPKRKRNRNLVNKPNKRLA